MSCMDIEGEPDLGQEEVNMLENYLQKLLVLDPDKRPKQSYILHHPLVKE